MGRPILPASPRALSAVPRYARAVPALAHRASRRPPPLWLLQRHALAEQGFDPARVTDPLYVYDAERETYVELDAPRYAAIVEGSTRL